MSNLLDDERIQFFLRHRDDILAWASIEKDVVAATREILAQCQPDLDERLRAIDPTVEVIRRDGSRYERILARRPGWPEGVGVALEWETGVDPFGGSRPKHGIFVFTGDTSAEPLRQRMVAIAGRSARLRAAGYKIPGDQTWPANRFEAKSTTWWQHPDAWTAGIIDALVELWPEAAAIIDQALRE